MTTRKTLNQDELIGMVLVTLNDLIDTEKPFSVHDLTMKCRADNPDAEIEHRAVRQIIHRTVSAMVENNAMTKQMVMGNHGKSYAVYTPITYS